jgi:hypothetical protein
MWDSGAEHREQQREGMLHQLNQVLAIHNSIASITTAIITAAAAAVLLQNCQALLGTYTSCRIFSCVATQQSEDAL